MRILLNYGVGQELALDPANARCFWFGSINEPVHSGTSRRLASDEHR